VNQRDQVSVVDADDALLGLEMGNDDLKLVERLTPLLRAGKPQAECWLSDSIVAVASTCLGQTIAGSATANIDVMSQ